MSPLCAIELAPLLPSDGASLFRERLSQIDAARPTTQDEPTIPKLLEAVGGLPLAIELMASHAGLQRVTSLSRVSLAQPPTLDEQQEGQPKQQHGVGRMQRRR